ncbi:unnamed protein product [Brassicogethes aeneus]|uniref:THO complex subunit 6 n=1 Tax=Brassicogethes aeneus TaxID=1431903 RepID=A0A9P0B6F4_BRAAE|nr:unnamed protein product [Brassicogethes aeneus]
MFILTLFFGKIHKLCEKMVNSLNKNFYNTVLSQAFSPCGNLLVVGDIFGAIHIFLLKKILNSENNLSKEELTPKFCHTVKEDLQINSLLSTQTHLIVGCVGEVIGYTWRNLKANKFTQAWTIELPENKDGFNKTDVNCMILNEENGQLYAGCGDNNIYVFDLETRKLLKTLDKHKGYIHAISTINNELVSGGEDGLMNIWDLKTTKVVHKIEPSTDSKVARPNLGNWIGAVSANEDYILCGGGVRLSLWHYRFLSNFTVYPIDDQGIHVAEIYDDKILAGGRSRLFYHMNFVGDMITEIPTSSVTTYSAMHQDSPSKILTIAGSSPKIDICSNFMYRDQQLSLY